MKSVNYGMAMMKRTSNTGYEYRIVKCPWCEHVFMWDMSDTKRRPWGIIYRFIETGEHVYATKCPKCNKDMVVLNHVLEGIDMKDNRVELISGED